MAKVIIVQTPNLTFDLVGLPLWSENCGCVFAPPAIYSRGLGFNQFGQTPTPFGPSYL